MAWLNIPSLIIEDDYKYDDTQAYYWGGIEIARYSRRREVRVTRERYVGCNYTAAVAKRDALKADSQYTDVHVQRAGDAGQYHCIAVKTVLGEWSEWAFEQVAEEE